MASNSAIIVIPVNELPQKERLLDFISRTARAIQKDVDLTKNTTAGKGAKMLGSLVVGGAVAKSFESLTPLRWAASGFGPLPYEFTKSGAIQVFELPFAQRALRVALPAAAKACLVFASFEAGLYIGALVNQTLSEDTKDTIGGTINEIINEGGWKALWQNPFGGT